MNLSFCLIFCTLIFGLHNVSTADCNAPRGQENTLTLEIHPREIYEGNQVRFFCHIKPKTGSSLEGKNFDLGIRGSPDHVIISNCHNYKPPPMHDQLDFTGVSENCNSYNGYVKDTATKLEWIAKNMTYAYSGKEWFCKAEGFTDCSSQQSKQFKVKISKPRGSMIMVGDSAVSSSIPVQALEGNFFRASCTGVGSALGYMKYKWRLSNQAADDNSNPTDDSYKKQVSSTGFMRFASISRANSGNYRCYASNAVGEVKTNMKLEVFYPPTSILLRTESTSNTTINITCKAEGTNFGNYLDLSLNIDKKDGTVIVWKQVRGDTINYYLENKMVYSGDVYCEGKMTFPAYQKTMGSNVYLLNTDGSAAGFLTSGIGDTVMYIIIAVVCILILVVLIGILTSINRRRPGKRQAYELNNPAVNKDPRPEAEQEDEEEYDDDDDPSGLHVVPLAKRVSKMNSIKVEYISGQSRI